MPPKSKQNMKKFIGILFEREKIYLPGIFETLMSMPFMSMPSGFKVKHREKKIRQKNLLSTYFSLGCAIETC